jgi:choline dehydrogenase-like flavoprotein
MGSEPQSFDYIVVGGGPAGCALASSLSKFKWAPSVLLIEAGRDLSQHPLTQAPLACFGAHFTDIDWQYHTVPQKALDGRSVYLPGGKGLGGGTAINYGTWTIGPSYDYDRWGKFVGDKRWSYAGLLPYFQRMQQIISPSSVEKSSPNRKFPMRQRLLEAWQDMGLKRVPDANAGDPIGVGEMVESFRAGKRQLASGVLDLSAVTLKLETMVEKVIIEDRAGKKTAVGVHLTNGEQIWCNKEVILSAGSYRTPQLLMLSGIGPAVELNKTGVPVVVESPGVGKNLHDHTLFALVFRLKDPSLGHSAIMGATEGPWADPAYQFGIPSDWIVTEHVPHQYLESAIRQDDADAGISQASREYIASLKDPRSAHLETICPYIPIATPPPAHVPMDGTHISFVTGLFAPSSRGTVTLSSASISDPPVINSNFLGTEIDRTIMRYGVRRALETYLEKMSDLVEAENPPPGAAALTTKSSDAEIDARIRPKMGTFYHGSGTAAMGSVVDADLRVEGVHGLRVADVSILPMPIGAHTQAIAYSIGLQAADIITGDS